MTTRQQLRQYYQTRRQALTANQQAEHAQQLANLVMKEILFKKHQHFGFYLAQKGEIDPSFILHAAWQANKTCYLPCLESAHNSKLVFAQYQPTTALAPNRYKILEPAEENKKLMNAADLEVVFVPLVAFDLDGNRLGMGGGYYDRTFDFIRNKAARPMLVGLAHSCQQASSLPIEYWDVPLNKVITEKQLYSFIQEGN